MSRVLRGVGACLIATICVSLSGGDRASAQASKDLLLVPHRAVYDLKLVSSRGRRSLQSAQGRIVYDFGGNACDGYTLGFRQVTELDSGEGKVVVSDLRSTTWEEGSAKSFRFNFQNFLDRKVVDAVDGRAERRGDSVTVMLKKPADKKFDIGQVAFPTDHMRQIVEAARSGRTLLELAVYDGSENGEKVYQTLAVIGQRLPAERKADDAAAGIASLAGMARWPVTISYFDRAKQGGEQMPVYAISFELYENGISRALKLDYGDFVVAGTMSSLEIGQAKDCR